MDSVDWEIETEKSGSWGKHEGGRMERGKWTEQD
jgi:hypothetical protein